MEALGNQARIFKHYYNETFGNTLFNFDSNFLKDIVEQQCLINDISQRKILIIYCHNEEDEFGKTVCADWFTDDVVENVLSNKNFLITGYKITRAIQQTNLKQTIINAHIRDFQLFSSIETGESKIYIFVPYLNTILCQSYIDSSITKDEFLEELLSINKLYVDIKRNILDETRLNDETQTCKIFQQIMFDNLGNRDFDVFFKNEHNYLKQKISYSFFGPPSDENGYTKKQNTFTEKVFKTILEQSDKYASDAGMVIISIIYVCTVKFTKDNNVANIDFAKFNPMPIFILRKCHGGHSELLNPSGEYCRVVIDSSLRVYTSWKNFLDENKYPESILCAPKNGEYNSDNDGNVLLEFPNTPACGAGHKFLKGVDITSAVAGVGSGGILAMAAIPAITFIAPVIVAGAVVAGAATGAYAIGRSIANLVDRNTHEQDIDFSDAEARAAYINIVAGSLGFVGAGANALLVNMARGGAEIGQGVLISVNTLAYANVAAGGVAIGNSVYDVTRCYFVDGESPSTLVLVQLGTSALFFGNAVYNFKTASTIVSDTQKTAIQDIQNSMRSNRHRRTFTKLHKETIRVNNGDTARGNAKVISTIRNANNVDETMAILTRNNRRFNELGVKFSAADGHVSLNGRTMDISKFSAAINKVQISEIMSLPQNEITALSSKSPFNVPWLDLLNAGVSIAQDPSIGKATLELLHLFRPYVQRKLVDLAKRVFSQRSPARNVTRLGFGVTEISCVVDFICEKARAHLKLGLIGNGCIRLVQLLVNHYLCGRDISDILVNECLDYVTTLFAQQAMVVHRAIAERARIRGTRSLKKCQLCSGCYNYHNT